jgi:serine protease Do
MSLICLGGRGSVPGAEAAGLVKELNDQLATVAEQVSAAVVVVSVDKIIWGGPEDPGDLPFDLYRDQSKPRRGSPRRQMPEGQGSGFVLRKDGYILTNHHVVEGATRISVRLKDGRVFPATIRGVDDKTDLAVLKVDAQDLPAVRLGDSDAVRVGEFAIAIGAPYSLDYSVTVGVISQKHRSGLGMASYEDFLQTDAKINPGNSGGPLLNIDGEVIGVNTLIRGLRTDIGFAIPINMARDIADKLIADGKIIRPWVGVGFKLLSADKALQEFLGGTGDEVVVEMLHPNAPAAKSPLRPADIIVTVNGAPIRTPKDVQNAVMKTKVGAEVVFEIRRAGQPMTVTLRTEELPSESAKPPPPPVPPGSRRVKPVEGIGLTVQPLNKVPVEQLDLKDAKGVFVAGTEFGGIADQAGLQHGDVITEIDQQPIATVEQYKELIEKADLQKGVLIFFNRQGTLSYTLVRSPGEN